MARRTNPVRGVPGGSVKKCITRMSVRGVNDPGALCASIADKREPGWRKRRNNPMAAYDHEIRELELYIDTDYTLQRQWASIEENLQRKVKSGKYDSSKAPKLWLYLVDAGAKKYCKEFGCSVRDTFPKGKVREPLAKQLARDWVDARWASGDPVVRENKVKNPLTLGKMDKEAIQAFVRREPYVSPKLISFGGRRLDGAWMGGFGIAEWKKGKIVFRDLDSKAAQTVQRAVAKEAPANKLAAVSNPSRAKTTRKRKVTKKAPRKKNPVNARNLVARALK